MWHWGRSQRWNFGTCLSYYILFIYWLVDPRNVDRVCGETRTNQCRMASLREVDQCLILGRMCSLLLKGCNKFFTPHLNQWNYRTILNAGKGNQENGNFTAPCILESCSCFPFYLLMTFLLIYFFFKLLSLLFAKTFLS